MSAAPARRGRSLRIAIEASTWINPRGYGRFTRELTRALLRNGRRHDFTVVVDSGAATSADLPDVQRLVVPTSRSVVETASANGARPLTDVLRMGRALSSRRFDVVLFPASYSFVPVAPGPFVAVVIHDALPEAMPEMVLGSRRARLLWSMKSRLACLRANLLATVSEASAREIRQRLSIGSRPLTVLTEGISGTFGPAQTATDVSLVRQAVPHEGRIVLFVGGLSPHKRVPELIRAFGQVARRSGHQDLLLALVGPDRRDGFMGDREAVTRAIDDLGPLASRVVRTGFVPDETLAALYRAAACLVLPSASEGFGLPVLEAMASGTPVVAARTPALQEVCGDAAEYADGPERLADAIERVICRPDYREELCRRGLRRAKRFSWDEAAERLLAALDAAPQARAAPC